MARIRILIHTVEGVEHRTKISTLRGDYRKDDGTNGTAYACGKSMTSSPGTTTSFRSGSTACSGCAQRNRGKGHEYEFRAVTDRTWQREHIVEAFIARASGRVAGRGLDPDMRIEPGDKTDEPIRTRGWTHWHHLFNPRQLLLAGLVNQSTDARLKFGLAQSM